MRPRRRQPGPDPRRFCGWLGAVGAAVAALLLLSTCSSGSRDDSGGPIGSGVGGVGALAISTSSLPDGVVGEAYNATINASGGTTSFTWTEPTGLFDSGTGDGLAGACLGLNLDLAQTDRSLEVSGTPQQAGDCGPFDVTIEDSGSPQQSDTATFTITIAEDLQITTTVLPNTVEDDAAYSQTVTATGGTGPYSWSVVSGGLPPGLSLTASTTLMVDVAGDPTTGGSFDFTLEITDSANPAQTATQAFTIRVLHLTTTTLPDAIQGNAYDSGAIATAGGVGPFTWTEPTGSFDSLGFGTIATPCEGLGLNLAFTTASSTDVTGTPLNTGTCGPFTLQVEDDTGLVETQVLSVEVVPELQITTTTLPDTTEDEAAYSQPVSASGGAGPYSWSVVSGSLPPGLALSGSTTATETVAGDPTTGGSFNFTLEITDSTSPTPQTDTQGFTILVLEVTTTGVDDAVVGEAYSSGPMSVAGEVGPVTWSATGLPASGNLTIDSSTGEISGTPASADVGDHTVTVTATDSDSRADDQTLTLSIVEDLVITTTSLPGGIEGTAYNEVVNATGGVSPYTWSEPTASFDVDGDGAVGTPCEGLKLDFTQTDLSLEITGTPVNQGDCGPFTLRIEDSTTPFQFDEQDLTITVAPGPVTIVTTSLVDAQVNSAYSDDVQVTGGTPPYTWTEPTGSFDTNGDGVVSTACEGLSLDLAATGDTLAVSGTPVTDGDCGPFDITVEDSQATPDSDTQTFTITVNPAAGRNDSIATATPLTTNGDRTITASISPYADPVDTANPDQDFYELTATAGVTVTVEIFAQRLTPASPLDPVLELLDANGVRFPDDCRDEGTVSGVDGTPDNTPNAFDDPCLNDDIDLGVNRDSKLEFLVPGAGTVTFFVRVLDWRGDARPDMVYELTITNAD